MQSTTDSSSSFMARRLADTDAVNPLDRDDAISADFDESLTDEDFVIETGVDLGLVPASQPMQVEAAEAGYNPANRRSRKLESPPAARPGSMYEPPPVVHEAVSAGPKLNKSRLLDLIPAASVGAGMAIVSLLDTIGPAAPRYSVLGAGVVLGAAWLVTQSKVRSSDTVRRVLWAGLLVTALVPAVVSAAGGTFQGNGMIHLAVGIIGLVAHLLLSRTPAEKKPAPAPILPAPNPGAPTGRYVFHPSGDVQRSTD